MPGLARYRQLGLCISCGGTRAEGRVRCEVCLEKGRQGVKRCNAVVKEEGRCRHCRTATAVEGESYCEACKVLAKMKRDANRWAVIEAYGAKCECCGETEPAFLTIDHVEQAHHARRRKVGDHSEVGTQLFRRLRVEGYPRGRYRVMCWSCNCARGIFGVCPHEKERQQLAKGLLPFQG